MVRTFHGTATAPGGVLLATGETCYLCVEPVGLVEWHTSDGDWDSGSRAFNVPLVKLGGYPLRGYVGASRGHWVIGAPVAATTDTGRMIVTSLGVLFVGSHETRDITYAELIGWQANGETLTLSDHRGRPLTLALGADTFPVAVFRFRLALANARGGLSALISELQAEAARPAES